MTTRRSQFQIRQEISNDISDRLQKRYRDAWIDCQNDLNDVVVTLASRRDPSLKQVKIIQTFHEALDVSRFLVALVGSDIHTVAFVGINMEQGYALKLARAISDPNSSIACLQLCRVYPASLASICPSLSKSSVLKELRLTFNHDLSEEGIKLLMKSVKESSIEIFKLYCVDLQDEGAEVQLAEAIKYSRKLRDLRVTSCNLGDIRRLAGSIKQCNRLVRVDLSMNRISDVKTVATLWETPSIKFLSLSQNELGSEARIGDSDEETRRFFSSLACNTTLRRMYLDMNPLSPEFVEHLTQALDCNVTLVRLGMLTLTVPADAAKRIRYLVSLNSAGRGRLQSNNFPDPRLLPYLLSKVSNDPNIIYGLLTQVPHGWL